MANTLSWASVVANGIPEEPPTVTKPKIDNEMKMNSSSAGEKTWRSSGNDYLSKTSYRRPYRNNCQSHAATTPEHRHHQGNFNRTRRHHCNSTNLNPRCPEPQNMQSRANPRSNAKQQNQQPATGMEPKGRALTDNTPLLHKSMEEQKPAYKAARSAFAWDSPSIASFPNNKPKGMGVTYKPFKSVESEGQDPTASQNECPSPRPRVRCQVTFSKDYLDFIQWQPISQSRQVWEPLDVTQRAAMDPSNPMPPLPPGFEHLIPGKRALSIQTLRLLDENVEQAPGDYCAQDFIPPVDIELRDQQHFIAKHGILKGNHVPQLKVTNGGTEDGYYVRQLAKWLPLLSSSPPEKRESFFRPRTAYWDQVRRNRQLEEQKDNDTVNGDTEKPQRFKSNGYFYNNKSNN